MIDKCILSSLQESIILDSARRPHLRLGPQTFPKGRIEDRGAEGNPATAADGLAAVLVELAL